MSGAVCACEDQSASLVSSAPAPSIAKSEPPLFIIGKVLLPFTQHL